MPYHEILYYAGIFRPALRGYYTLFPGESFRLNLIFIFGIAGLVLGVILSRNDGDSGLPS